MTNFPIDKLSFCVFIDDVKKHTQTICKAEKALFDIGYDNDFGIHHSYTRIIVNLFTSAIVNRYHSEELVFFADEEGNVNEGESVFIDIIEDIFYNYIYGWTDDKQFIFDNAEDLYDYLTQDDLADVILETYKGE